MKNAENTVQLRVALALLVFVAGCAGMRGSAPVNSPGGAEKMDPAAVVAEARSAEARAAWMGEHCALPTREEGSACVQKGLLTVLNADGVRPALEVLERLAAREPSVERDAHVYAHAIGIAAYGADAEVGQTFAECTPAFQSGCYHGVIQAYFGDRGRTGDGSGIDSAAVNALCNEQRAPEASRWLLFQCAHGLGHGLTMFRGHDLPRSLADCDLLAEGWEREACYGGAFMEAVVNATAPHHGAVAMAGDELHGGDHHHADGHPAGHADAHTVDHNMPVRAPNAAPAAFPILDSDDPHHPCSSLGARYLNACYSMQTSVVLWKNDGDVAATAAFCDTAPEHVRSTCFVSLGRDISAITLRGPAESARLCEHATPQYRRWCHTGVAKNFVDVTANAADGLGYCRAVPDTADKAGCYRAVGEQIWVLERDRVRRGEWCRRAELGYEADCRAGTGLPTATPSTR